MLPTNQIEVNFRRLYSFLWSFSISAKIFCIHIDTRVFFFT